MSVREQLQNVRVCVRILFLETALKNVANIAKRATTLNISDLFIDGKKEIFTSISCRLCKDGV